MNNKPALLFILVSLSALILAVAFGLLASFDFVSSSPLLAWLPFQKLRPLHVNLAVAWIFAAAISGIYYYIKGNDKLKYIHLSLFSLTGIAIIATYLAGIFGGREYFEFHPLFVFPIIICWLLFALIYFKNIPKKISKAPVYIWMWSTGIIFFLFTYVESNLWIFSYFNNNIVKELTVQWKAYGALVGSWNMLVYGTALYVMEKISGDKQYSRSNISFMLFFLGLTNLMFGWAHHLYFVPAGKWIRITGYAISMTELLLLGKIIWNWRKNIINSGKHSHLLSFKFLSSADLWILINLIVAISISVPAINVYTHGTFITAAHAMGSTIGINTMILFSSLIFILHKENVNQLERKRKLITTGLRILNISLFVFFISLIVAGLVKGIMTYSDVKFTNNEVLSAIRPYYLIFITAGIGVFTGIIMIAFQLIKITLKSVSKTNNKEENTKIKFSNKIIENDLDTAGEIILQQQPGQN